MTDTTHECKHGSLKRSCEICERDAEIDRLERECERLMEALRKPCDWCEVQGRCKNLGASSWSSDGPDYQECRCICHVHSRALEGGEG